MHRCYLVRHLCRIKEARKYVDKYKRVEIAVDAYYNDLSSRPRATEPPASTSKLNAVFDNYAGTLFSYPHVLQYG